MLRPDVQAFAEQIQASLDQLSDTKITVPQLLQKLDDDHCDLFKAIHERGTPARIKKYCVDLAVGTLLMDSKVGGE